MLDQYYKATGKQFFNVKNIKLNKVINKEAIELVENAVGEQAKVDAFSKSPVGKMANWIIKDAGKGTENVIVGPIKVGESNFYGPNTKSFNVEIILK